MAVTQGYYYTIFVDLRGHTPAIFGQKGNYFDCCPLLCGGGVCPNDVLEKKKKAGMLGMGCGHLASASELNPEPVGASENASRGRVFPIPQFA